MDIGNYLAGRALSAGRTLCVFAVGLALAGATAQAQNPVTAPTTNSQSGVQSVITQTRDSLQRRMSTGKPQPQDQQPQQPQLPVKNPDSGSSDQK